MKVRLERCARCGGGLSPGGFAGCCRRCLAAVAFGPTDSALSGEGTEPAKPRSLGGFELIEEIGRGGMGVVYRARQADLGREVALKVLTAGPYADPVEVARFRAEAAMAASLHHPGIVAIHEVGEADGHPFFSMELIQGSSLAALTSAGPLESRRAARYVKAVAEAVGAAHAHGILHRDIKPGNVLVDQADQVRVTDFGLARPLGAERTQHVAGSPGYLPPEQADPAIGAMGVTGDVYGLGALLYHLVTGRPPFGGTTLSETLTLILRSEAVRPRKLNPRLPKDLETICLKCLAKDPAGRYASAMQVAQDLEAFLEHRPIQARPVGVPRHLWLWSRRHPGMSAMGVLLTGALALGLAAFLWESHRNRLNLYAADLRLAAEDIEHGDLTRARDLLTRHAPTFGPAPFSWRYLQARSEGDRRTTLGQHAWIVTSVAWSPDHRWIASGSIGSGSVTADLRLWRPDAPGTSIVLATNHIGGLQWFPDSRRLLAVGSTSGATIWDAIARKELAHFAAGGAQISREGKLLATCEGNPVAWEPKGAAGPVWVRELESGEARRLPEARLIALSPSGKTIALSDTGDWVDLYAADTGRLKRRLSGAGKVWSLVFSADDKLLVATGFEPSVRVWRLDAAKTEAERWRGHALPTWRAVFSPDGASLLSTSSDQTLRLWNLGGGTSDIVFRGHGSEVWCADFSPDGREFVSGGKDRNVIRWSAEKPPSAPVFRAPIIGQRFFSADGRGFVARPETNADHVLVHELTPGGGFLKVEVGEALALDATGDLLSLAGPFTLSWADTAGRQAAREVRLEHGARETAPHVWAVAANGSRVAALSTDRRLSCWDGRTGRRITSFQVPVADAWFMALSPDGDWVVLTLGEDGFLLCSLRRQTSQPLTGHLDQGKWAAFTPDSRWLATASSDATIKIWRVDTGREGATLRGHLTEVSAVAAAPDGRTLASVEEKEGLRLWDLPTLREVAVVPLPDAGQWLQFSPDGRWLAVGLTTGGVRLLAAP